MATLASLWQNREKPFTTITTITTAAATAVWNSQDSSPPVPTTQFPSFCWRFYSFLSFTLGFTPGTLLQLRMTSGFWYSCLHLLHATVTNVYNHTLLLCGTGDGTKGFVCTRQTLHQLSHIPSFPDVLWSFRFAARFHHLVVISVFPALSSGQRQGKWAPGDKNVQKSKARATERCLRAIMDNSASVF